MAIPQAISTANKVLADFFGKTAPLRIKEPQVWALRNDIVSEVTRDGKGTYIIWPFPFEEDVRGALQNISLYIGITVSLDVEDISEVNIKVFKEDISLPKTDGFLPTELLLRAEWSNIHEDGNHAHPHWHIHSYKLIDVITTLPLEKQKTILELINEEISHSISEELDSSSHELLEFINESPVVAMQQENIEDNKDDVSTYKLHLAMLAEWDKLDEVPDRKTLTPQILRVWLPKCLNYIRNQFQSLIERMPVN